MSRRWIAFAAIILVICGSLLTADLGSRGPLWMLLWSITGETSPVAQTRGAVEWLGNGMRVSLRTAPLTPIDHVSANPYGINTFLEQEVEVIKRDRQVAMIAEAGFGWIRQEFPWQDIEIHERGDFVDRRNDPNGIDAWAKYDHIVDVIEQYGLRLQVRLSNPPAWTHSNPDIGEKAPPDDLQDFVNFAVAVAERYRGRILHYQVWNEPNIYPEWGEQAVNPEAYTEMLCRTYSALKEVDPNIIVISAALAPTINLTDRNLNDGVFLQRMYDAGAARCFDVMSTQGYGFYSGPTDRRMRPTTLTFSHHLYLRDVMVANHDAHKPIWLAEAGWNAQPEDPATVTIQYGAFGIVTPDEAAAYMPLAYQRARQEWPWLGVINYWFFKRADESERNQAFFYFRMVEPDFTLLPIYSAMQASIGHSDRRLYQGVHQAEDWRVGLPPDAQVESLDDAQFGSGVRTSAVMFTAYGTDVRLRWRGRGTLRVNDVVYEAEAGASRWHDMHVAHSLLSQQYEIRLESARESRYFEIDSITVIDRSNAQLLPLAGGALVLGAGLVHAFVAGTRDRRRS